MTKIRLRQGEWDYDPDVQLGPRSGFGTVLAGRGSQAGDAAIKRFHVNANDAGLRELRIAELMAPGGTSTSRFEANRRHHQH